MSRNSYVKSFAAATSLLFCSFAIPSIACAQQTIAGVQVFPANNVWNTRIDSRPVDANSDTYVNSLGRSRNFHPDWGAIPAYGIPYNIVQDGKRPLKFYNVTFDYSDESDAGPYPISSKLKIEGGSWILKKDNGDRHVLMIDPSNSTLYETWSTNHRGNKYTAGSGAIFHLDSNVLRPDTWTSADAAGLPIFPALVNYDEAATGSIKHAFRMTCSQTKSYVWPARHLAGPQNSSAWPPLGKRFRLKSTVSKPTASPIIKTILTAMQQYGVFIADQGSSWYMQGISDPRWTDDDLDVLKSLTGNDFEVVDEVNPTPMMVNPDSGQAQ